MIEDENKLKMKYRWRLPLDKFKLLESYKIFRIELAMSGIPFKINAVPLNLSLVNISRLNYIRRVRCHNSRKDIKLN